MIFCPYGDNEILEGGELIFKHPDSLYEIKIDSCIETNKNNFVMLIFSIDMYCEVLPIIKGTKWVFNKPLFVRTNIIEEDLVHDSYDSKFKKPGIFGIIGDY
jgi:hypothetical protein